MLLEGPQKGELATVTGRNADGHWTLEAEDLAPPGLKLGLDQGVRRGGASGRLVGELRYRGDGRVDPVGSITRVGLALFS